MKAKYVIKGFVTSTVLSGLIYLLLPFLLALFILDNPTEIWEQQFEIGSFFYEKALMLGAGGYLFSFFFYYNKSMQQEARGTMFGALVYCIILFSTIL